MNAKVDFDDFAEDYGRILQEQLKFFDGQTEYFSEYKIHILKKYISKYPKKILEYGCGIGRNLRFLREHFPNAEVFACDISERSLSIAQRNNPFAKVFLLGKDIIKEKFDLIFIALVFHHIDRTYRMDVLEEIKSLLASRGDLFAFEHNPYNPVTRHLVNTCPFDADAILLKKREMEKLLVTAGFRLEMGRYALYFPSALKKLRFMEPLLGFLPLGGQYFIKASHI